MSTIHVTPVADLIPHSDSDDCPCLPHTIPEDGGFVVVHNAWDGPQDPSQSTGGQR